MQAQELAEMALRRALPSATPVTTPQVPAVVLNGRVPPPLALGDRGPAVAALQALLVSRQKLTPGSFVPGEYDRGTQRGVQALQKSLRERAYRGPVHGVFDATTQVATVDWDLHAEQVMA